MIQDLQEKKKRIAVLGLGYVGLPLALEFAKKYSVIGFDINKSRIAQMRNHEDPSQELSASAFDGCDIEFTANTEDLQRAHFFIVTVPTPIDIHNIPNLEPLLSATQLVGAALKSGDYVVYESTVYPGATEEDCLPILERLSGLSLENGDFSLGFSPERINPGDKENSLVNILKIVSGNNDEALETIATLYGSIIKKGIYRASSIKVAEAAKIIENTQRDINIALMNELSQLFAKMGINSNEVIEAASTKWNFYKVTPGLVGGHCIGVDPYYLTYKASQLGHHAQLISAGRAINDGMPSYVAQSIVKHLVAAEKCLKDSRVLVMGITFKENVSDIRNSKIFDVVKELQSLAIHVDLIDPHADADQVSDYYGCTLAPEAQGTYDAIVLATKHNEYCNLPEAWFREHVNPPFIFFDLKGAYYGKFHDVEYFSL
ncbi:MAG: nucleotide sugar dehydrogenase [Bacteroidales bacterium]|jgi:UDP-N-acetyl-D-galactosamine dehydrogenase|nr:nucleotide sugar dehydrogenase [Bacteroidales bacterium]